MRKKIEYLMEQARETEIALLELMGKSGELKTHREEDISWEMRRSYYALDRNKLEVKKYLKWKSRSKGQPPFCEEPFPSHLVYNTDQSGCPIILSSEGRNYATRSGTPSNLVEEALRVRHNLPARARLVLD